MYSKFKRNKNNCNKKNINFKKFIRTFAMVRMSYSLHFI